MSGEEAAGIQRDGNWVNAAWSGDIDISNATGLEQAALGEMFNSDNGLTIDLGLVTYIDSAGIRSLLNIRRLLEDRQQRLLLVVPSDSVLRKALEIGGVIAVISVYSSMESAGNHRA
ncbi:MAG: STAS domain-containing protein [Actinomycetota bacterium]